MMPESFAAFVPLKPEPIYKYSMEGAGKKTQKNFYFCLILAIVVINIVFHLMSTLN